MSEVLLGVIVGWGLTTGAEAVRAWWRLRQAERERKIALRRAARVILEELLVAERATKPKDGGGPDPFEFDFSKRKLPAITWNANRETLAVAPESEDDWEAIARAFARVDELNWAMDREEWSASEMEAFLEELRASRDLIGQAVVALRSLAKE